MKILLVEDDLHSTELLSQLLAESHYTIDSALNAKTAWQYIETYAYDLIILDIMLPDSDGIELCTKLRAAGYKAPVLLLTAKDSTNDRVMGLEAGADDYMVKPYEFQELIARIRALLRRYSDRDQLTQELIWEQLRLDLRVNIVSYKQKPLRLTQKEYGLLELFLRHPQQAFSRSALIDQVWSAGECPSEEAVTTHIKGLRQKLRTAGLPIDPIETLYGLGYRLKPAPVSQADLPVVDSLVVNSLPEDTPPTLERARVLEVIAIMSKKLIAILPASIALLRRIAIALNEGNLDPDLRYEGYMEAHRLIGSMGSLGFPSGSEIARQIEQVLKSDFSLGQTDTIMLMHLIADLEASISDFPKIAKSFPPTQPEVHKLKLPLLLIVDDDVDFIQDIQIEAEIWGMRVQTAAALTTARQMIANEPPDVVLLDIIFADATDNGLTFLEEITQREPKIPTVVMSASSKLSDHVMVARSGGCSFIEKPTSTEEVLNVISQVLSQQSSDRFKVMVVDDDPNILKILKYLLEQWGIEVTALQNPQQFWQVLELTAPDLLLLDLIMPEYSGIDLCQAVRTSPLWHDLPIVFLSTHSDRETVRQLFAAGADDYLSKPIVEADLCTHILSRLKRSRMSRQVSDFDGLTGVYTHRRGIQGLTQLLRLATRNQQMLCLAILDLDLFKQVNDRYGHSIGDMVLKQFGNLLRQNFRSEDVTMRWGGEEFVVGLYGADLQQSLERLNILLEIWREQKFVATGGESFSSTFSAGVVAYPDDGTNVETLYRKMDEVLYRAKVTGRNRIVATDSSS